MKTIIACLILLYEFDRIMARSGEDYPLMVCSGDVLLDFPRSLPEFPRADLLALGMWVSPETASEFGVFFSKRSSPGEIDFFLQKPRAEEIRKQAAERIFTVDAGVWLLGRRTIELLLERCGWDAKKGVFREGAVGNYELYGEFGPALGAMSGCSAGPPSAFGQSTVSIHESVPAARLWPVT